MWWATRRRDRFSMPPAGTLPRPSRREPALERASCPSKPAWVPSPGRPGSAGPTGVVCPHGAVRDLRFVLERYLDAPFVVLHDPIDAFAQSSVGERRLPQLWTWSDRTTAARIYLVTPDGPMPVNEQGARLPPHYAQVAALARQDPQRQSCLVLGAKAPRGANARRRHPTV
ncbi:hypothetical protein [Pandoravirus japonicus]|uniref:Uncharacterized protein n=1 Tax=Pandoravirus japonicus TaxID=2823154 RepID=A0A811BMP7_9VIRU|nr:hypothetical protein [Pandoravirus japonicus]